MNERIEELMSIICEGQNSIQREEVENYINNLQSKIDKAIDKIEDIKMMAEFDNCKANMILDEVQEILEEDNK